MDKINYLELPASDIKAVKSFFTAAFGWHFTDYGEEYAAFYEQGETKKQAGGFYKSDLCSSTETGAALIVFYSENLHASEARIQTSGGSISKPVYSFPGGRRFHFTDPCGNEYAVWSDKED